MEQNTEDGEFILGMTLPKTTSFLEAIAKVVAEHYPNAIGKQVGATWCFYEREL